jgi:cobalt-zinc-cadmium resistance protein CzcA
MQKLLEKRLLKIPEVKETFARTGTAEVATDPMPPSISDGYVMLKPRDQWPDPKKPKSEVVKEVEKAAEEIAGSSYEISQPIQLRFNELISGCEATSASRYSGTIWTCWRRSLGRFSPFSRLCRALPT